MEAVIPRRRSHHVSVEIHTKHVHIMMLFLDIIDPSIPSRAICEELVQTALNAAGLRRAKFAAAKAAGALPKRKKDAVTKDMSHI